MNRLVSAALAVLLAFATAPASAQTDAYPTKSITVYPLLAAGTGMDVIVRLYSEQLSQALGRPVVVENRPGSGGLVGVAALKTAVPDGHTLMAATSAVMAIRPTLLKQAPYDPQKDFVPVALYVKSPFILVVNPALPINSVPELIKYVKANPGKLSFSSSGVGGAPHLAGEYLKQKFGLDLSHVPYKNSPQSIADVAAGHVAMAFAEAGASVPLIKAGKLRALAVTATTRLPTIPDVPPFAEVSGVPDFEAVSWHALVAPAAIPRPALDRLHAEMKRIMAAPAVKEKITGMGLIPQDVAGIEETRRYMAAEAEKWGTLVRQLGLQGTM